MIQISRPICPNPAALAQGNYKHNQNKTALRKASFDKCMYCESITSHVYYGDVEHIIPKSVKPELEFTWDNLGYVCAICNGAKRDKYDEELEIINPYNENPSDHLIAVGSVLYPLQGSPRGDLTILDVDLNRRELIQRRQDLIDRVNRAVVACFNAPNIRLRNAALQSLKAESEPDKEYSSFVGGFLRNQGV